MANNQPEPAQSKKASPIVIRGRSYAVEVVAGPDGRPGYVLVGSRGARYRTCRNQRRPERMFLVGLGGRIGLRTDPLGPGVWLSDEGGELSVL